MSPDRADFGSRLRATREARGISLKDIAATTKISVLVLEALERNDASRLPGGLFSRAFVRSYAKEVGLDPEQTVREFAERFGDGAETAPADERARATPPRIVSGSPHSGVRWLGLAATVLLVIVWIGVDRYFSRRAEAPPAPARAARADAPPPAPAPPALPKLEPPKVPSPLDQAAATEPGSHPNQPPARALPSAPQPAQPGMPTPAPLRIQPQAAASAEGVPSTAEPRRPAADLPLRIVVSATAPCWVSAKVDDQRVPGRTLQPGEKLELSAAHAIVLTTGNAGALSYTINNAPGRSLGASGEVVTVVINTSNYRMFVTGRD